MEAVQEIKSSLINDKKNRLYQIVHKRADMIYDPGENGLGMHIGVDVPRTLNNLSQIKVQTFYKSSVTSAGVVQSKVGFYTYKMIQLKNKRGYIYATLTPEYMLMRDAELEDNGLGRRTNSSAQLNPSDWATVDNNGSARTVICLPMWFTQYAKMIQTRYIEQLELELITQDTQEAMNITSGTLSQIDTVVMFDYYNDVETKDAQLPRTVYGYDIYREKVVDREFDPVGSYKVDILLTCPHETFVTHFMARVPDTTTSFDIERIVIEAPHSRLIDLDTNARMSYETKDFPSTIESKSTSIYWSSQWNRDVDENSDYITFSGSMYPVWASVYFKVPDVSQVQVHVIHEYKRKFIETKDGFIESPLSNNYNFIKHTEPRVNEITNIFPVL
jgi:hypothetical protein